MKWEKQGAKVEVRADLKKLQQVIAGISEGGKYTVKVGILANKDPRKDKSSNATIGLKHEFGSYSEKIPERSFIRMPLRMKEHELVKEIGRLSSKMITEGNIVPLFKQIGLVAEGVIADAFQTGGFGFWEPLSPVTVKRKKSDSILIDSGQLRRSITSAVVKRS